VPKAKFEIGDKEKHLIETDKSILWKTHKVKVDGKTVINDFRPSVTEITYDLEVGDVEKHQLQVTFAPFVAATLKVDGKSVESVHSNR
jgi:hypothetical protein